MRQKRERERDRELGRSIDRNSNRTCSLFELVRFVGAAVWWCGARLRAGSFFDCRKMDKTCASIGRDSICRVECGSLCRSERGRDLLGLVRWVANRTRFMFNCSVESYTRLVLDWFVGRSSNVIDRECQLSCSICRSEMVLWSPFASWTCCSNNRSVRNRPVCLFYRSLVRRPVLRSVGTWYEPVCERDSFGRSQGHEVARSRVRLVLDRSVARDQDSFFYQSLGAAVRSPFPTRFVL